MELHNGYQLQTLVGSAEEESEFRRVGKTRIGISTQRIRLGAVISCALPRKSF